MIKIEKTDVFGWESAIRGMRNPLNSWDKSDTVFCGDYRPEIGDNDLALMKKLVNAGSDHSKFMRMINVTCDITAPLYWWKEFDTYKVGTVANSCSTMHKIHDKEFTLDDFSIDTISVMDSPFYLNVLKAVIEGLNTAREHYLEYKAGNTQFDAVEARDQWRAMIELLPSSYNQKRTVQLNYAVLRNMYLARRNHKLDEWHTFCDWVKELPYSELITGETR
jgi:hypothetical protein